MAKNLVSVLNSVDKLWVDIYISKYGHLDLWHPSKTPNASGLYFSISKVAVQLRHNFLITAGCPSSINLWSDPWLDSIPINRKPTFLNMSIPFELIQFSDLLVGDKIDLDLLSSLCGPHCCVDFLRSASFAASSPKSWVWTPNSSFASVPAAVYDHLVSTSSNPSPWPGWSAIWKLNIPPRVKVFIWKWLLGKLPTFAYLYAINIGPNLNCVFCDLGLDSADHFLCHCGVTKACWLLVADFLNICPSSLANLGNGNWLFGFCDSSSNGSFTKALVACCCWAIWKARCNFIYRNDRPDPLRIFLFAVKLARDFAPPDPASSLATRWEVSLPFCNFPFLLFSDASWFSADSWAGLGFIILDSPSTILAAGFSTAIVDSPLCAEAEALLQALLFCRSRNLAPSACITDCRSLKLLLDNPIHPIVWRLLPTYQNIKDLLLSFANPDIVLINRLANAPADRLASLAFRNPRPSLFFRGMDRPCWLDELSAHFGLHGS